MRQILISMFIDVKIGEYQNKFAKLINLTLIPVIKNRNAVFLFQFCHCVWVTNIFD